MDEANERVDTGTKGTAPDDIVEGKLLDGFFEGGAACLLRTAAMK